MARHDPHGKEDLGERFSQFASVCGITDGHDLRSANDTPALNALKALRGAPISMGRGETPVELCQQPSVFAYSVFILYVTERGKLCKKRNCLKAIMNILIKVLWRKERPTISKAGRLSYSRYSKRKTQIRLGRSFFVLCRRIVKIADNLSKPADKGSLGAV